MSLASSSAAAPLWSVSVAKSTHSPSDGGTAGRPEGGGRVGDHDVVAGPGLAWRTPRIRDALLLGSLDANVVQGHFV